MIKKLKDVQGYQWCIGIMITIIIALGTLGYTETVKKIDSKADEKSVKQVIEIVREEQREQKALNKEMRGLFQQLTIQVVILNEKQKKEVPHGQ